jgi:hypothetical protein
MGGKRVMRVADLLEGSTMFRGLEMNVAQSNRLLGVIDGMQALTWIFVTTELAQAAQYAQIAGAGVGVSAYGHASAHATAYTPLTPVSLGHASPAAVYTYMPLNYGGSSIPQPQPAVYLAAGSRLY